MKIQEVREMPNEDIRRSISEKRRALFNLRFQKETEQLERPAELRQLKKDIARMCTVLRQRETSEAVAAAAAPGAEAEKK